MKEFFSIRSNRISIYFLVATFIAVTVTGIIFKQRVLNIIPLYVSMVIGLLQTRANRYSALLGGFNSILYAVVYLMLGLYASAFYAILFSFPVQIATFIRWNRRAYGESTEFRSMNTRQRICVLVGFIAAYTTVFMILRHIGSDYQHLDTLSSLLGILISILTMLSFIEYTWLMLPSGIIGIILNISVMQSNPGHITYLIFSVYSLICVTRGFFRVRKLYAEQQGRK